MAFVLLFPRLVDQVASNYFRRQDRKCSRSRGGKNLRFLSSETARRVCFISRPISRSESLLDLNLRKSHSLPCRAFKNRCERFFFPDALSAGTRKHNGRASLCRNTLGQNTPILLLSSRVRFARNVTPTGSGRSIKGTEHRGSFARQPRNGSWIFFSNLSEPIVICWPGDVRARVFA